MSVLADGVSAREEKKSAKQPDTALVERKDTEKKTDLTVAETQDGWYEGQGQQSGERFLLNTHTEFMSNT